MKIKQKRGRPSQRQRTSIAPLREFVGSYIDTIDLIQDKKLDDELFERLQLSFGPSRGFYGTDIVPYERRSPTGYVIHHLALHRPTRETTQLLRELIPRGQRVYGVAVALDVLVRTDDQALAWSDYLERRMIFSAGQNAVVHNDSVTYYNKEAEEGTRLALYSDRICRLNGNYMACHVEARLIGSRTTARSGLSTSEGILAMNHRRFWDARLDLRKPPSLERLARARNRSANARNLLSMGSAENQQFTRDLLDSARNAQGVVVAQALLEKMRSSEAPLSSRPLSRFTRERHDWLLPARENVHWHPEAWS